MAALASCAFLLPRHSLFIVLLASPPSICTFQVPPKSQQSLNPNVHIKLSELSGNGLNLTDLCLTTVPPAAFPWLQVRTDVPTFDLATPESAWANTTQIGCYSLSELVSLMSQIEREEFSEGVAITLYRNLSLHGALAAGWPAGGFDLHSQVYFVGVAANRKAVMDFDLLPNLMSVSDLTPVDNTSSANALASGRPYILFTGLTLVNLPSNLQQPSFALPFING